MNRIDSHINQNIKTIALYNHKGGVSKTTTAFNLGWALADQGKKVLLIDLDPQCNLSGMLAGFSSEDNIEEKWYSENSGVRSLSSMRNSISKCDQLTDILERMQGEPMATNHPNLKCILGHISISELDPDLSLTFKVHRGIPSTEKMPALFVNCLRKLGEQAEADIVIYDLSPSIGALNELTLLTSDYFIIPCLPDYFSLQTISSLSNKIVQWKKEITDFLDSVNPDERFMCDTTFMGYVMQNFRPRSGKPAQSFQKWIERISNEFKSNFVPQLDKCHIKHLDQCGKLCMAEISNFNSLIAVSQNCSKPVFCLEEQDIKGSTNVTGAALNTMLDKVSEFANAFTAFARKVLERISD